MELIKNTIFDENMLYEDILHCVDCIEQKLQYDENGAEKEKLVSKMYGNAFALLLRNGFVCGKDESEGKVYYCMNINDKIYRCEESLLKNILFRDFNDVINAALR